MLMHYRLSALSRKFDDVFLSVQLSRISWSPKVWSLKCLKWAKARPGAYRSSLDLTYEPLQTKLFEYKALAIGLGQGW